MIQVMSSHLEILRQSYRAVLSGWSAGSVLLGPAPAPVSHGRRSYVVRAQNTLCRSVDRLSGREDVLIILAFVLCLWLSVLEVREKE